MTSPQTLLERVTADARAGDDRQLLTLRSQTDLTALAANAQTLMSGGWLVKDVAICKVGSFNGGDAMGGIDLDAADLAAVASRFSTLCPTVFVPPIRLDHGWSIRDVVGAIAGVRVTDLADESDGDAVKPFLTADLHIIDAQSYAQMKAGLLRARSAELGPYRTNSGEVHPLVLWGLAFVDIPAVEGLGAIKLSAAHTQTARRIELTETTRGDQPVGTSTETAPEQTGPDTSPDQQGQGDQSGEQQGQQGNGLRPGEVAAESGLSDDAPLDEETPGGEQSAEQDGTQTGTSDGQEAAPTTEEVDAAKALLARAGITITAPALTPAAALRAAGHTDLAVQLERQHTEAVALAVDGYVRSGKIPSQNLAAKNGATTLLGHSDPAVVEAARALLSAAVAPVKLGEQPGRQSSEHGPGGDDAAQTPAALSALDPAEFPAAWQNLTADQRADKAFLSVYDAWRATSGR